MERQEKDQEGEFEALLEHYRQRRDCSDQELLVELLRETQEIYGYIPADLKGVIAEAVGMKESVAARIVKLYPSLKSGPARHVITVCTGKNCERSCSAEILEELRMELNRMGKAGGRFRLNAGGCLKHCRTAPNLQVDEDFYTNVKPEDIKDILNKY